MAVIETSGNLSRDWFSYKGGYGIIKDEYREQMAQALAEARNQAAERVQVGLTATDKPGAAWLNKQQVAELVKKYDVQNMSRDEYTQFIDELCGFGAIPEAGKPYLGGLRLTPLEYAETGAQISAAAPQGVQFALPEGRSNLLDWVRYRASFEEFDPFSQSFRQSPSAALFARLEEIMEQMLKAM